MRRINIIDAELHSRHTFVSLSDIYVSMFKIIMLTPFCSVHEGHIIKKNLVECQTSLGTD